MRNTLICTVGTSLFGNIRRLVETDPIRQALETRNWKQLSLYLLERVGSDRLCGAEINSIISICNEGLLHHTTRLIFLISDTEDGKAIGEILKQYYESSSNPVRFEQVEKPRVLEGLRDDSVYDFQRYGLKNLVREVSAEARKFSPETIAINATGGYKAQISFAGMIGQALEIPVYYLFERFSKVIELPPQPVSLDLRLWLEHYSLFEDLETEQQLEKGPVEAELENSALEAMLDEVPIDDIPYITLSAMGQLFHERCRLQFEKQETTLLSLVPKDETSPERKPVNLRDDHGQDILEAFAKKLCRSPYVKGIVNSLPFNPRTVNAIRRVETNGIIEFVLIWTDQGLGLCIQTTGRTKTETSTIALHLEKEYKQ